MFSALTPIIRSSYNCNYSFWYWLTGSTNIRSRCWVGTDSCVSYGMSHLVGQLLNSIHDARTHVYKKLWPNLRRYNSSYLEGLSRRDSALNRNLKPEVPNKKRDIHSTATSGQVTVTRTIINDDDLKIKFWFSLQKLTVKLLLSLRN